MDEKISVKPDKDSTSGTGSPAVEVLKPSNGDSKTTPPPNDVGSKSNTLEAAPAKPPRPLSPRQQAEAMLKEAFPNIDQAIIRAVLTASGGNVEPAFNALLGMSDPSAQEETPPPQPPRPTRSPVPFDINTSTPQNQLEADAMYARQLAEHYQGTEPPQRDPRTRSARGGPAGPTRRKETGLKPNELYEEEHSFLDDDLPVIKENIRKTFLETQSKVNKWVSDLKKKIDGEDVDDDEDQRRDYTDYGRRPLQGYGNRRSGERDRYDADPQVLGDDLAGLELRDDETPPPRPTRPLANPDLFKPTPSAPGSTRKVSFQTGPPSEIRSATPPAKPERKPSPAGGKSSKWEPLSAVEPSPMGDNDPFSLGDSDDEREMTKPKSKKATVEDADKVEKAAAEAMAEDIAKPEGKAGSEGPTKSTT